MKISQRTDKHSGDRTVQIKGDKGDQLLYVHAERLVSGRIPELVPISFEEAARQTVITCYGDKMDLLSDLLKSALPAGALKSIMLSMLDVMHACEENGLERCKILFRDDCVFFDSRLNRARFCYIPLASFISPEGESQLIREICKSSAIPACDASLARRALSFAQETPLFTTLAFEGFLKQQRVIASRDAEATQTTTVPLANPSSGGSSHAYVFSQAEKPAPRAQAPSASRPEAVQPMFSFFEVNSRLRYKLKPGNWTIGRDEGCDIHLSGFRGVSRRHAELTVNEAVDSIGSRARIADLQSTNGVLVNGTAIQALQRVPIRQGDVIQLGSAEFHVD